MKESFYKSIKTLLKICIYLRKGIFFIMYSYIVGKIVKINQKSITVENNFFGYSIFVANPNEFENNKIQKVYLYKNLANNNRNLWNEELYGFKSYDQKELFLNLLNVSGVGVKTAILICKNNANLIKNLIFKKSYDELSLLENITPKLAKTIIDQLSESFLIKNLETSHANIDQSNNKLTNVNQALKSLGYQKQEIQSAINKISETDFNKLELSDLIASVIKIINSYESQ